VINLLICATELFTFIIDERYLAIGLLTGRQNRISRC
jgi:hypothetical protein